MTTSLNEKLFFLDNDREVNQLVFKIGGIFMLVMFGMMTAAFFDVFKLSVLAALNVIIILFIAELIFFILLRCKIPVAIVKYYGLLAMESCVIMMVSNAYFGIYITYIIVPVISCLYFDRKLTRNITLLCYIGMIIGLWFRAPGAIKLAYPGYTRIGWFTAFGLGYTLEYAALTAVVIAVAKRSRRYMEELYHRNERIGDIQDKIIYRFADLVESRDDNTGKHVKRTSKYAVLIAKCLAKDHKYQGLLSDTDITNIELAAPLHDIGKISVPDSILLKPGKLTDDEFEIIKTHTVKGEKIIGSAMSGIEREEFLKTACQIALSHHEKWDGSGYPNGISGTDIPLPARIMAVADVFDALVNDRCYKKAMSPDEAFSVLREGSGSHFDPIIVAVFVGASEDVCKIMNEQ